ncbi:transcriptional regulator [Candidatus Woesearchaeota archaeon]|nr:transcriptional regulator [Candidatus Woesearchaeota archaeon]
MTRRTEIIEMLKKEAISAQELCTIYKVILSDIEEDLQHIAKTVKPEFELSMYPAVCKNCGFIFKERSKIRKPSKCPKCKSESIDFPKFKIEPARH